MNSFTRTVDLLHRALDVNALRYEVTANNLANAEVPGFKRTDVNFEAELKRALDSQRNETSFFRSEEKTSELQ
nr:flagellar basal body rod protein FlgB [Treponema pallidum]